MNVEYSFIPDIVGQAEKELIKEPEDINAPYRLDLSADIPDPEPILKQGDVNICTLGNFSCIVGQAKSRKTYLISSFVGAFLCEDDYMGIHGTMGGNVLYIDTEQSVPHVKKVIRRIHRIAGYDESQSNNRLGVLFLRELDPVSRINSVLYEINKVRPSLCVIDGVGDLMNDTNSNTESVEIATLLLQLTTKYNCHIITVVHTNPGSDKARGHIGSEIIRKAETVISVRKDGDVSRVTASYCRDIEFQEFAFMIGADGLPELTEIPVEYPINIELKNLFTQILPLPNTDTYNNLKNKIIETSGVADKTARRRIQAGIDEGIIVKNEAGYYHLKHQTINEDESLPF